MNAVDVVPVDRLGPFQVNRVGLEGPAFPMSFECRQTDEIWCLSGTALAARDIAELAPGRFAATSLLFNIGHNWFGTHNRILTPREIAMNQGVDAGVHDVTWAARSTRSRGGELLVIATDDLRRFFSDWSLYDIDRVDALRPPTSDEIDRAVLEVNSHAGDDWAVLSTPAGADHYFHGHDDCYFNIEARDGSFVATVLSYLLASLAGSRLISEAETHLIKAPSTELALDLLRTSQQWSGQVVQVEPRSVTIGLAPTAWRLGLAIPAPTQYAKYHTTGGTWTL